MDTNNALRHGAVFLAITAAAFAPHQPAGAGNAKVAICHATASVAHPYVRITVDQDSVDGDLSGRGGSDHYGEHVGPIGPVDAGTWGDIIPPIPGVHAGLNWDERGAAIFANGCGDDGGWSEGGGAY